MTTFVIMVFLAIAVMILTKFLGEYIHVLAKHKTLITIILSLIGVYGLDYSAFAEYDVAIRNGELGKFVTAMMVAGLTLVWGALFTWMRHGSKSEDSTVTPLKKAA